MTTMTSEQTRPICRKCNQDKFVKLRYDIKKNGEKQFYWWCTQCECSAIWGKSFIRYQVIRQWFSSGRLKSDFWVSGLNFDYTKKSEPCAVCGKLGTEWHHWAPRALQADFGNYEEWAKWPTTFLCKEHHQLWHKIVTPHLKSSGRTEEDLFDEEYEYDF